jgi:hypothetical protein
VRYPLRFHTIDNINQTAVLRARRILFSVSENANRKLKIGEV